MQIKSYVYGITSLREMSENAVRQFFYKAYCVANGVDENWIMIRNSKKDLVAIKGHGHLALEQVLPTSYPL